MAKTKRLLRSFFRLLLPVVVLVVLAVVSASIGLVYSTSNPPRNDYLVTPDKYGQLSTRAAQVTEENWTNLDGTTARGWLLRGAEGAPAVILLHAYGADRSYVLNLGVKMNEATNFTILMPDLRGHGKEPLVRSTCFGGCETEDAVAAIKYLRGLQLSAQTPMVGQNIGIFGVELGAISGLSAAAKDESVKALVLDSVPVQSDKLLASAVQSRYPFASFLTAKLAQNGTYLFFANSGYNRGSLCETAKTIGNRQVLFLAGADETDLQDSTIKLSRCFPNSTKIESKTDLNPSGSNLISASLEQTDAYDQRVITFFKQSLEY